MAISKAIQKMSSASRLNLGCGYQPLPGWVNVDYIYTKYNDIVVDLNKQWPWRDNSIQEIFCSHVLEHLEDPIHFFKEAQRVLKKDGYLTVRVPHGWSDAAMGDPTHKRPYFVSTFIGFTGSYSPSHTLNPQHDKERWPFTLQIVQLDVIMQEWVKKIPFWKHFSNFILIRFLNAAHEIAVVYQKK